MSEPTAIGLPLPLISRDSLDRSASVRPAGPWTVEGAIEAAVAFLAENLGEPITLHDMARVASMSPYHFSRVFRERMGVPPHRYLNQLRLERSTELLRTTDLAVSQISWRIGFKTPSHFINTFRKRYGTTPLQYRRRTAAAAEAGVLPGWAGLTAEHAGGPTLDARPCPLCGRIGSPFG